MDIKDFLQPAHVVLDLRVSDKTRLLQELARQAGSALNLPADRIASELSKRETLGSTGTGGGIAIPHARLEEVSKPFGILARLHRPIGFDAIDDKPVDLVFLLLLPARREGEQLNALACVARRLRDPEAVSQLRQATTAAELYRTFVQQSEGNIEGNRPETAG